MCTQRKIGSIRSGITQIALGFTTDNLPDPDDPESLSIGDSMMSQTLERYPKFMGIVAQTITISSGSLFSTPSELWSKKQPKGLFSTVSYQT